MGWKNPPTKFVRSYREAYGYVVREATIRLLRGVITRSPVDTGRFKSNWQVAEGSAPTGTVGISGDPLSVISKVPGNAYGKVLYVVNNLPYAERLENGWSEQAPTGMVKLAMMDVQDWLKSLK